MGRELPLSIPPLPLLFLLLVLNTRGAGAKGMADFFRPLTCAQHPSLRRTCGGNPERFYAGQCLQWKCCHDNGTCYHHAIDASRQRRNAGILGGVCAGAAGLLLCTCIAWRLKGAWAVGKEVKEPRSDAELADYLRKLLEETEEEEDEAEHRKEESKERGE